MGIMADLYKIVIYRLEERDKLARLMCGKLWMMDRRSDVHTCGSVVMAILKQR